MTNEDIKSIPKHNSPLRHILGQAHGIPYQSVSNLEEAKLVANTFLVMEGDYGGQIYLVCPVKLIKCSMDTLQKLLIDIDLVEWDDEDGRGLYFEVFNNGDIVSGGMGGGIANKSIWVHKGIQRLKNEISKVINGKKLRINLSKS